MKRLAINMATRCRPEILAETMRRSIANIRRDDTVFMVSADADDEATIEALQLSDLGRRIKLSIKGREDTVGAKWNRILSEVDADVYLPMSDDTPVITPGFDEKILAAASLWPDGIGFVANYLRGITTCECQAVTKKFTALTGYIYPEHFPFWFVDTWLLEIARHTDRIAFADIRFDRFLLEPTMGLRDWPWWADFFDACRHRRRAIAHKIIDHLDEPEWRKTILRDRHPLNEVFARLASANVRKLRAPTEPSDARYLRVKAAAVETLREMLPELRAHEHEQIPEAS